MAAPFTRTAVQDFALANRIYAGATVALYTVDEDGEKTATLATLYDAVSGSGTLDNPQTLDSKGKFAFPVYIDEPVIGVVSGLDNVDSHETGIIAANLAAEAASDAQAAAALAFAHARRSEAAANRSTDVVFPAAVADTYLRRNHANTAYVAASLATLTSDVLSVLASVIQTFLGTTTAKAARQALGLSGLANGSTAQQIAGGAVVPDARVTVVQAESGVSDTLTDVTATNAAAGDWIGLLANSGHTITVDGASGNIVLQGPNLDLSETEPLWLCYDGSNWYQGKFPVLSTMSLLSTDAGATAGPELVLDRQSASPAAADVIGKVTFRGKDDAGNAEDYASIEARISDPTSTSEDSYFALVRKLAGAAKTFLQFGASDVPLTTLKGTGDSVVKHIQMSGGGTAESGNYAAISTQTTASVGTSAKVILTSPLRGNAAVVNGNDGTNYFSDLVVCGSTGTPAVAASSSAGGSPAARSYAISSFNLTLAMGSGTYNVAAVSLGQLGRT